MRFMLPLVTFARESGLSREYIGRRERGVANPTIPVTAQFSHGIGMMLTEFVDVDQAAFDAVKICWISFRASASWIG